MIPLLVPKEAAPAGAPPDARAESGETADAAGFGAFFAAEDSTPKAAHSVSGDVDIESGAALPGQKTDTAEVTLPPDTVGLAGRDTSNPPKAPPAIGPEDAVDQGGQSQPGQTKGAAATTPDIEATAPLTSPKEPTQALRSTVAQSVVEGQIPQAKAQTAAPEKLAENTHQMVRSDSAAISAKHHSAGFQNQPPKPSAVLADATDKPNTEKPQVERATPLTPAPVLQTQTSAVTAAIVPPMGVALTNVVQGQIVQQTERQIKPIDPDLGLGQATGDRPTTIGATVASATASTGPETARHAAQQIAVAVTNAPGNMTEISLNPEELGRVRLSMTASEGIITLNVAADRPETMDLLRRHIDALAQEFRDLGYDSLSFSFGSQTEGGADEEMTKPDQLASSQLEELAAPPNDRALLPANAGLDLRL